MRKRLLVLALSAPLVAFAGPSDPFDPGQASCHLDLATISDPASEFASSGNAAPTSAFICTNGVTKLYIDTVTYLPNVNAKNVGSFQLAMGYSTKLADLQLSDTTIFATATSAQTNWWVFTPFLFDTKAPNDRFFYNLSCTSGVQGRVPTCGGQVVIQGTTSPANLIKRAKP